MSGEVLYCEMCGSPITGRAYRIVVESTEMIVCERCYRRYMERARRSGVDAPFKLRVSPLRKPTGLQDRVAMAAPRRAERRPGGGVVGARRGSGLGMVERYEVVEDFASRIRAARQRAGLTQRELAQRIRVGENVVKRIESGALTPSIELARRIERVLKVKLVEPVAELEEGEGREEEFQLTLGDIAEVRED